VSVEDSGSKEDLSNGFELHPSKMRNFLDLVPGSGGDAQVFQSSQKPAGEDRSFAPRRTLPRLHLGTSFRPQCRSGEGTLHRPCLLRHGPPATAAPQ
jgi:hypothetical protein